ncbi:MAG: YceI family protein [Pseudomonadota bacterium]
MKQAHDRPRPAIHLLLTMMALLLSAAPAVADLRRYTLDPAGSEVGFTYRIQGTTFEGAIPVTEADIAIDFTDVGRTRAEVALNARQARAGVVLATQALRGASVLNVDSHPTIRFSALRTRPDGAGAVMEGDLTVRGVTRPVALRARFLRPPGADPDARDRLTILLTGSVSRFDYGASGYPNIVGDTIGLRIRAAIRALD